MKIFLTMISILAFIWSCGSAVAGGNNDERAVLSVFAGDLTVEQVGAAPTTTDGNLVDNNGVNEIFIGINGLTNRNNEIATVTLTLREGVTPHADDSNTAAEGILSFEIADPDGGDGTGEGEIATAERGRFVVEFDGARYDLVVSGGFAAQEIIIPPTAGVAGEVSVSLLGSAPSVALSDNAYTVSGLTNRADETGTIGLGAYALQTGFTFTTALSTTLIDPPGTADVASADFTTFTITETLYPANTETYTISGAFVAQATAPAPVVDTAGTPDEIVVTLTGSTPAVSYDGSLGYTVSGLVNRAADGSISISGYTVPDGFTAVLNSNTLPDPPGTGSATYAEFATITVTETAYPANVVEYTISGGYAASVGATPPDVSAITVKFPGSFSVVNPTDTNLDVTPSGPTYVVAGLTNRPNEDVTLITNAGFVAPSGYTISPITKTYTPTPDADASSGPVELGTFTIAEIGFPANVETYTISGTFAAQEDIIPPAAASEVNIVLAGSSPSVALANNVYTVSGLTNRAAETGTIGLSTYSLQDGFTFTTPLSETTLADPNGIAFVPSEEFATFTITETAYSGNTETYIISGEFAAQIALPAPPTSIGATLLGSVPVVGALTGTTYPITGLTNRNVTNGTIDLSSYTVPGFRVTPSSLLTLTDPGGTNAVPAANLVTFAIEETAYAGNSESYTINGEFEAQPTLPSPPPSNSITAELDGSLNPITDPPADNNYNIRRLTNRANENVTLTLEGNFALTAADATKFNLSSPTLLSISTPAGVDAGNRVLANFTISENAHNANNQTYTITGVFAAQPTLPAPPLPTDIFPIFPGSFSISDPTNTNLDMTYSASNYTYTVLGLTNRFNGRVRFEKNYLFPLPPTSLFTNGDFSDTGGETPAGVTAWPGAIPLSRFTTWEKNYPDNNRLYRIEGEFAGQASVPGEATTVVYNGTTNVITISPGGDQATTTFRYVADEIATVTSEFADTFKYSPLVNNPAEVAFTVGDPNPGSVIIKFTPTAAGTLTARYFAGEINFPDNGELREYTIIFQ